MFIKVSGLMEFLTVKVNALTPTGLLTKENGEITNLTEWVMRNMKMDRRLEETSAKE